MADPSPEIAAQLHSLESSYAENPARFFVPFAGLLREAGQPERAEELLRENLKRFSGLSAHVLLGRCLADRGAYQEASNEFHYVLSVDSQNLIALRTLAEMAAASGRPDEARRWYGELLTVDPTNGDARAAVARLAASGVDAATADQPAGSGDAWGGAGEAAPAAGEPSYDAEWGNLELDGGGEPEGEDDVEPAEPEFDAFGFGEVELGGGAAPEAAAEDREGPDAGDEFPLLDFAPEAEEEEEGAAGALPEDAAEPEMVTETMAELYATQGLRERAAEVYRELIQRRGEEPGLVRRLAELEEQPAEAAPDDAGDTPDWLLRVDQAGAEEAGTGDERDALPDLGLLPSLPDLDFGGDEAPEAGEATEAGDAGPLDEDPFAASVSDGFAGGAEAAEPVRAAWESPEVAEGEVAEGGFDLVVIDESAPLDGDSHPPATPEEAADLSADWAVAAAPLEEQEDEVEAAAEGQAPREGRTMRGYFATLLAWAPAAQAAAEAPEPAPAWEEEASRPAAADEPWYEPEAEPEPQPQAHAEPMEAPGAEEEPEPAAEPEEPLPWELPAEAPGEAAEAPAPAAEGGFSFEDFFGAAPAPEPEPAREPEPAPGQAAAPEPAPAPQVEPSGGTEAAGEPAAGEEDEDLESFQAWLQSLKR